MDEDFLRIPFYIEADGSKTLSLAYVKMTKGYQIGPKGNEQCINEYWDALVELMEIPTPRFRRRNKNNIPGIVSCMLESVEGVKLGNIKNIINKIYRE